MKHFAMSSWIVRGLIAGMVVAGFIPDSVAHHSAAMYDSTKTLELDGVLTKARVGNPHSLFWVEVPKQGGGVDEWMLEAGSPALLGRWAGISDYKELVKMFATGQKVSAKIHPVRNGRKSGALLSIALENGQVLGGPGDCQDFPDLCRAEAKSASPAR
ncbi:MAG: DUF6152 family protein [Steroidobacteraceae bacterium]